MTSVDRQNQVYIYFKNSFKSIKRFHCNFYALHPFEYLLLSFPCFGNDLTHRFHLNTCRHLLLRLSWLSIVSKGKTKE